MKEVKFFRQHFDWDSVAGKSENTMIPDFLMKKLFSNYKYVFIWLDRDKGGKDATESYLQKYPQLISINYEIDFEQKDPTDRYSYLKSLGKEDQALEEIKLIINKAL